MGVYVPLHTNDVDVNGLAVGEASDIEFLTRSSNRVEILEELRDQPMSSSELRRSLDVPRTTLRRNLVELTDRDWVREKVAENEFELLQAGEIILSSYTSMMDEITKAGEIASFHTHMAGALPVDSDALRACSYTCSTAVAPHAPMTRQLEVIGECGEFQAVLPVVSPHFVDRATALETTLSGVVTGNRAELNVLARDYPEVFASLADDCRLQASDELPGYGLYLTDETDMITTFTDNMRIHTLLEAPRGSPVSAWVRDEYDAATSDATPYDG